MTKNIAYQQKVLAYAEKWRHLLAWGAPLPMKIEVEAHKGQWVIGYAKSYKCEVVIRCTGNLSRDLATVLHELAHLAAPNSEGHGMRWREVFARAAAEALECDFDDFDIEGVNYLEIDQQVIDMCESWLEGQ